jgi:hypothetical protein
MRQVDFLSALQPSANGIDKEFKSARIGVVNTQDGTPVLGATEKPTGLAWEGLPRCRATARRTAGSQLNDRHKASSNLLSDDNGARRRAPFVQLNPPRASRLQPAALAA